MAEEVIKLECTNIKPLPQNIVAPDLVMNKEYELKGKFVCGCGKEHYDVGLPMEISSVTCVDCREILPGTTHWCHPSRFIVKS